MNGVSVSSDGSGTATVTTAPGTGSPGNYTGVRNIGDVAWYQPVREFFIRSAYAVGESVNLPIGPNGSTVPSPFTIPAKIGDWLEFKQCLKANPNICSAGFRIEVILGTNNGGTAVFSSPPTKFSIDPGKGQIYYMMKEPKKGWDWKTLFVSTAYAQEAHGPGPLNVDLSDFTAATCGLPAFASTPAPTPKDEGNVCTVKGNNHNPGVIEEVAKINCNPQGENRGVYAYDDVGMPRLAVWSANKLIVLSHLDSPTITLEKKWVYPADISHVQSIGGHLIVFLDRKGNDSLPHFYVDTACASNPVIDNVEQFIGFDNNGSTPSFGRGGEFVATVKNPRGYCAIVGTSTRDNPVASVSEEYCQSLPLTVVQILPRADDSVPVCGLNYVVLSPNRGELIYTFHPFDSVRDPRCVAEPAGEARSKHFTIPGAVAPVSFVLGNSSAERNDPVLVVLDSPADKKSKLIPFKLEAVGYKFNLAADPTKVQELPIRGAAVGYDHNSFISYPSDLTASPEPHRTRGTIFGSDAEPGTLMR